MKTTEDEITSLKEATREAHEVLQELKEVRREVLQTIEDMKGGIQKTIEDEVKVQLLEFQETVATNIERATQKVFDRFDTITETLLGEDKRSQRKGRPSIPELLERRSR